MMNESKGQILIVTSNQTRYEQMTWILKESGYETTQARTVAEGLRAVNQETYELFILDWLFEDGTGIELCRALREVDQQTPIFFYTEKTSAVDVAAAMQAGAQGCFLKPGDPENS
jgi:DNA-binding response OmpR family regulator